MDCIAKINLYKYRLTETNLEALASEFYGKIAAPLEVQPGFLEVGFENPIHKEEFLKALSSFLIDFGEEKP